MDKLVGGIMYLIRTLVWFLLFVLLPLLVVVGILELYKSPIVTIGLIIGLIVYWWYMVSQGSRKLRNLLKRKIK
jgi:Flp pilus assembly protein TadB